MKVFSRSGSVFMLFFAALTLTLPGAERSFPPQVSLAEVQAILEKAPRSHPRLLATDGNLAALKAGASPGPLRERIVGEILRQAGVAGRSARDAAVGGAASQASRAGVWTVCSRFPARIITGRRFRRIVKEMLAPPSSPTGTHPLPRRRRDEPGAGVRLRLAVRRARAHFRQERIGRRWWRRHSVSVRAPHNQWVKARNNWSQVCHTGLAAAALAILEPNELAARTVHNAVINVPTHEAYAPRGSYPEAPGIGPTAPRSTSFSSQRSRRRGHRFQPGPSPGFDQTSQYLPLVTGPSGRTFNHADGGSGQVPAALHWLISASGRRDWLRDEPDLIRARPSAG
jgi:hypothetical protein